MANSMLVSVIVATHNHAHYLPESIGSVLAQSHAGFELIVVDDGSQDDTHAVVQALNRGSIRYLRQRNRGLAAARNLGLAHATGEFVAFLDADDRFLRDHLQISLAALSEHPEVAFVCGDLQTFGIPDDFEHVHSCAPTPDHYASLLRGCFIVNVGACLFRRAALLAIDGFDESCKACEDWDLFLRLVRYSALHCHHRVVLEYRRSPDQMSRNLALMLGASMRTLNAQRKHLGDRVDYFAAYADGLADIRRYYGDPAVHEVLPALAHLRFGHAVALLRNLCRWYPAGLTRCIGLRTRPGRR